MHNLQSPRPDTDETIETEIRRKGLTAPRITPADIEKSISAEFYATGEQMATAEGAVKIRHDDRLAQPSMACLTFCTLVLTNGFTVTGESAVASPENFDADIGRRIARANAVQKIWPLMGYALRSILHEKAAQVPN